MQSILISAKPNTREKKGEVGITNTEWDRIARLLEIDVEEIRENSEASNVMNNFDNSSGNYVGNNNTYCNIPEFILKNQQEYIEMLKEENQKLKEEIKSLQSKKQE